MMAFTPGISNIKIIYPYSVTIGTQEISADKIANGISIAILTGDFVTLQDGNEYEKNEILNISGELVDLSSAEKSYLYSNIGKVLGMLLKLDNNTAYEYLTFTSCLMIDRSVQAGRMTNFKFEFELRVKNADSSLAYSTYEP